MIPGVAPRVSVVIPALNEAANLGRCLAGVHSQVVPPTEVIVVDNGSTDGTAAAARSHGARVVHEPVRGRARARNAGIRRARGALLVFLDADCLPQVGWLERLLAPFEDSTVGCVGGETLCVEAGTELTKYLIAKRYLSQTSTFAHPFLPFAATATVAFRRKVFELVGLFDESLPDGEDADLSWRMQLETDYKILHAPEAKVHHLPVLPPLALLRQKRRHGYAAALLFKKYRVHRHAEERSLRHIYWEYRSLLRRNVGFLARTLAAKLHLCGNPPAHEGYQLLLEIGEKLGRLEGCLRHRIWYP